VLLRRGDIVLVDFDPAQAAEAAKTRPAVIVSNNIANSHAHVITVIPLTTSLSRVYPHEMVLPVARTGLDNDSKTQVHLIRHVSKTRIRKTLGHVPEDLMQQLDGLLREHLSL
jgi:mRNA interferase MazF